MAPPTLRVAGKEAWVDLTRQRPDRPARAEDRLVSDGSDVSLDEVISAAGKYCEKSSSAPGP
jgi:hypothetical protein